jgi:hypothetical protein
MLSNIRGWPGAMFAHELHCPARENNYGSPAFSASVFGLAVCWRAGIRVESRTVGDTRFGNRGEIGADNDGKSVALGIP